MFNTLFICCFILPWVLGALIEKAIERIISRKKQLAIIKKVRDEAKTNAA